MTDRVVKIPPVYFYPSYLFSCLPIIYRLVLIAFGHVWIVMMVMPPCVCYERAALNRKLKKTDWWFLHAGCLYTRFRGVYYMRLGDVLRWSFMLWCHFAANFHQHKDVKDAWCVFVPSVERNDMQAGLLKSAAIWNFEIFNLRICMMCYFILLLCYG